MAVFTCPQCGHSQAVDDKHVGKTATCPKCKTQAGVTPPVDSTPDFTPVDEPLRRMTGGRAGPLGIRCEGWLDHARHINKASHLGVDWWCVVDEAMPVRFAKPCGVIVHNIAKDYPLELVYRANPRVQCHDESITACEIRFMTFDVWGEHTCTLSGTVIADLKAGEDNSCTWQWNLFSQAEGEEYSASLGFVSRVRLASGAVRNADPHFILREAKRFSEKFTENDLEPRPPTRKL